MAKRRARRNHLWSVLVLLLCLATGIAAAWPGGAASAQPAPLLTLEPDRGPCAEPAPVITARGGGFPPGSTISLIVWRQFPFSDQGAEGGTAVVGDDGRFAAELRLVLCGPDDLNGARFRVYAQTREGRDTGPVLASAIFTRTATTSGPLCFTETGRCIGGRFLDYWLRHGGLELNGYPLTGEFEQVLEDGNAYTVQYFERTRLEHHPEHAPPYDVLLGQFGRRIRPADPPVEPEKDPTATYFAETGHHLGGRFLQYWEANGGLAQFGYPISEEFEEELEDGNVYTVQYFERARFELHPRGSIGPDYIVLLGQFGRRILAEGGR